MEEKNEIYLKIIRGEELSEEEDAYLQEELQRDPGLRLMLDELRTIFLESSEIPAKYLQAEFAWDRFQKRSMSKKILKRKAITTQWWKYAAAFIGILVIGYGVFRNYENEVTDEIDVASEDHILLQLADGRTLKLDESDIFSIAGTDGGDIGYKQHNEIHYEGGNLDAESEEFNRLMVPFGKRFRIYLSDGSRVHLNSGSILRYPVSFRTEGIRQIFLEEGEAYFEIVEDKQRPFVVKADNLDVRVLGTEFNVSSYRNEDEVRTVLVRGAVEVGISEQQNSRNAPTLLSPGEMASYSKVKEKMEVENVEILNHTAWKDDRMIFIDEPFNELIKKVERCYRVTVVNNFKALDTTRFYGDFDITKETVEDVLKVFKTSKSFDYSIEGDIITIKELNE